MKDVAKLENTGAEEYMFDYFKTAADYGNSAEAQCLLGECYYLGEGVEKNTQKAIEWCQKAAWKGNVTAQYKLGVFYGNGLGAEMDKAVKWYQKAAEQGHADAQYCLAKYMMFVAKARGTGDEEQAIEWYRKAIEQGHLEAQKELGDYYYDMAKKCKAVFFQSDEMMDFYKKTFFAIVVSLIWVWSEKLPSFRIALISGQLRKLFAIIFDLFWFVVAFLVKQESFKNTESYWTMMDYLCEAVSLGHKAAKREYILWG